ncbi:MAG: GNAT family N-acetyltransferase [Spirochaetaceae bacterium]|nr:GNAT family N-acetyltransferase [Spirochaetaceae bacterium]
MQQKIKTDDKDIKKANRVRLIKSYEVLKQSYIDYIREWENSGEEITPQASCRGGLSFPELLKKWKREQTEIMFEKGLVPCTLYFLMGRENRVLGAIHHRHELNDSLLENGGHIGFGVRPSERHKGYASLMLRMLLNKLQLIGYDEVLITCNDDNIASAIIIEKNHGILYKKPVYDGVKTRQYWIEFN